LEEDDATPQAEKRSKDREYKFEEIQKILAVASPHLQVAILFMASSGIRVGAFEFLNVGHVKPLMSKGALGVRARDGLRGGRGR
jgi:hypothetical protein